MKLRSLCLSIVFLVTVNVCVDGQKRMQPARRKTGPVSALKLKEIGSIAVVVDETLSVLRAKPSLFAESVQRMRRGRRIQILGVVEADGVKFYRVSALPGTVGWVQADAVFGKFREGDDARLASLVQASNGFDQIELASSFFELYPQSQFRPALLLLYGDLLEEAAVKLSKDARSRLDRREMTASGAPIHSYYLNFVMLDRYRKLNIVFLFNSYNRNFHYDGAGWKAIVQKFPAAAESIEAQKRLNSLKEKMEVTAMK